MTGGGPCDRQRDAWDSLYSKKGPVWRGLQVAPPPIESGSRILEVGCGDGKTLSSLPCRDCSVTALDFSARAVRKCQARFRDRDEPRLVIADARHLPFDRSHFDLVIMSHVLEHLLERDRRQGAEEARRVLACGGRLLVRAFTRADMRFGEGDEVEDGTFMRGTIITHYFNAGEVEALFPDLELLKSERRVTEKRYEGRVVRREWMEFLFQEPG
jgi:ubiquinone/menaquinone biosynthesis C-methylase UbiE